MGFFAASALVAAKPTVSKIPKCGACGLLTKCRSPKMPVDGRGRKRILLLGEAPGKNEDDEGRPFVGPAGQHLEKHLARVGVDMRKDCWLTNSLICWPGEGNPTPTDDQIAWCNTPEAPIWMGDLSFKSLGEIQVGDEVIGWDRVNIHDNRKSPVANKHRRSQNNHWTKKRLVKAVVTGVYRRKSKIIKITMASGRVIRCSPNHLWLDGWAPWRNGKDNFQTAKVGKSLCHVVTPVGPCPDELTFDAGYLSGMMDGEGTAYDMGIAQSWVRNSVVCRRLEQVATRLGFQYTWAHWDSNRKDVENKGSWRHHISKYKKSSGMKMRLLGGFDAQVKLLNWCRLSKKKKLKQVIMSRSHFLHKDKIVSIEPDGEGTVISMTTTTGNYIAWGYASKNCRPNLFNAIAAKEPDIIICFGLVAVKSLIGHIWREDVGPMKRWAGFVIPSQAPNAWITPTYHPSYLLRQNDPVLELHFHRHLKAAVAPLGKPWRKLPHYERQVQCLFNVEEAAGALRAFIAARPPLVAIDYETDRLKCDSQDARVVCCSVSDGKTTLAYPWHGAAIELTKELWLDEEVGKIASNLKFEHRWTWRALGVEVRNWAWDTMLAAHTLDNREGVTGLKFQAFVRLGQQSYDDHVRPFLHAKNSNRPNRIAEVDLMALLRYCGTDALLEYVIAKQQMEAFYAGG